MARRLEACDVFHSLSGYGLRAHRVARQRYGALTVCDRGSSHILYQDEILAEEHSLWKVPYRRIDPRVVDRELQEYEECDLITVPSDFAYRTFIEKGVAKEKLRLVPYGVDLSLFRPVPKRDKIFRVIYVGALSLRKGIPYLLQAVEALGLPGFELWLIGGLEPRYQTNSGKACRLVSLLGRHPSNEAFLLLQPGLCFRNGLN